MEVRQSWRVGTDCKSVVLSLSRFESYYFHHWDFGVAGVRVCLKNIRRRFDSAGSHQIHNRVVGEPGYPATFGMWRTRRFESCLLDKMPL
jgi:hypothetical protein